MVESKQASKLPHVAAVVVTLQRKTRSFKESSTTIPKSFLPTSLPSIITSSIQRQIQQPHNPAILHIRSLSPSLQRHTPLRLSNPLTMTETILFSFPDVSLFHDPSDNPESSTGLLTLSSASQPTDFDPSRYDTFLRIQHTPDSPKRPPTDTLVEAFRTLHKTSPTCFTLESSFGDLTIVFPDLHQLIPQDDVRLDIPADVRATMTWDTVVAEFEAEIDRFVSYQKNQFSMSEGGGLSSDSKKAEEAGFASKKAYQEAEGIRPYVPGVKSGRENAGRVVLVDEENGEEVGEVGGMLVQTQNITAGSKDPVEITLPENGTGPVLVRPADYLGDALSPAYASSTLVQTAATASRLIVTTSTALSSALTSSARAFTEKTKPNATPMTFQPATHTRMHQLHNFSNSAATVSAATVGKVQHFAQNAGAKIVGKDKPRTKSTPQNPGVLNKSLIAFSTIADGIDYAAKNILASGSSAASTVVAHRYGAEAGVVAAKVTGSVKNVGLVYIDASGVSRRAVVKGVAKGMVVGRVKGGGEVLVPGPEAEGILGQEGEKPPPAYNLSQMQPGLMQPHQQESGRRSVSPNPSRRLGEGKGKDLGKSSTWRF